MQYEFEYVARLSCCTVCRRILSSLSHYPDHENRRHLKRARGKIIPMQSYSAGVAQVKSIYGVWLKCDTGRVEYKYFCTPSIVVLILVEKWISLPRVSHPTTPPIRGSDDISVIAGFESSKNIARMSRDAIGIRSVFKSTTKTLANKNQAVSSRKPINRRIIAFGEQKFFPKVLPASEISREETMKNLNSLATDDDKIL